MNAIHILLVDDEERFVLNLARLLKARGYVVSTAFDGQGALALLSSEKEIAVVVLDVRMPGMDGIDTLQRIRERYPEIEVIMLTGQATLDNGIQAVRRGAFDYLQKPCDIEDLEAKIKAACSVEQIKRHPVLWPRSTAGEIILSGFLPLLPEDTLECALAIFNRYRNGEGAQLLFVVDDGQRVQGLIGKRDMLAAVEKEHMGETFTWEWVCRHPQQLPSIPVSRIMHREVETVSAETSLVETARRMLLHHYDSIPVVSEDAVLGIIRLRDVLQYLQAAGEEDTLQEVSL
jgi:CheY-like chemotaxis protein